MSNLGMRNVNAIHTDFGFLHGLFKDSPKIIPSNLDMIYGINGSFLIAEWKNPGEVITQGQKILLKSLHKEKNFTVLLIEGNSTPEKTVVYKFYQIASKELIYLGNSVESLKSYIETWYKLVKHC